jgi:hypothetical protein
MENSLPSVRKYRDEVEAVSFERQLFKQKNVTTREKSRTLFDTLILTHASGLTFDMFLKIKNVVNEVSVQ